MSANAGARNEVNVQTIRESYGRVVYSHKTHEKAREIESTKADMAKWVNITLVTLTSGTLLTALVSDQRVLLYISSIVSALALAFTVFQLSFSPEKAAEQHRATAKELWLIREKYVHLLADVETGAANVDIRRRRNELIEELNHIYRLAPDTSNKAYRAAQQALQINEDMTFSDEELDRMLPASLRAAQ